MRVIAVALVTAPLLAGALPVAAEPAAVGLKLELVEHDLAEGRHHERELKIKTADLERELIALRAELVTTARAVQIREERLTVLERQLAELAERERRTAAGLYRRRTALAATLGALERLGRRPPEALISSPVSLTDSLRTSLLLSAVVPVLDDEARELRVELGELSELRRRIAAERAKVSATRAELATERRRIDALLARKSGLQQAAVRERERQEKQLARLAEEARDLRELLEKLTLAAAAPPPPEIKPLASLAAPPATDWPPPPPLVKPDADTPSFSAARGTLPLPVRGRFVRVYGQVKGNGTHDKGITIETRANAQVVTPYDGRVVFAGPFRGYGLLLIIEHGEGYHTLLAGFSRIDSTLGQWLLAGEPVGVMGSGSDGTPALYVELRRNGEAINPLPWLAASARKVNG